jgi:hypothetical protein
MTFEELGPGDCRFPVEERDEPDERSTILFCGEPALARSARPVSAESRLGRSCPYCEKHMMLAYKDERHIRSGDKRRRAASAAPAPEWAEPLCLDTLTPA